MPHDRLDHGETEERLIQQLISSWRDLNTRQRGDLTRIDPRITEALVYLDTHARFRLTD